MKKTKVINHFCEPGAGKSTGIVRKIDDLGRINIPRDIRKICEIKEGDPLEIFTSSDGAVILKPYAS